MLLINTYIKHMEGKGICLFSAENVKKDTKIWEFAREFDRTVSNYGLSSYPQIAQDFILHYGWLEDGYWTISFDNDRFTSHSSNPNTYEGDGLSMYAKRDIAKDEEITCNYLEFCEFRLANGLGFKEI